MAIDYAKLKARAFPDIRQRYGARECILYALGVGVGVEDAQGGDLRYVFEQDMRALPTMAVTLGYAGFWLREPDTGLDWANALLVDQEIALHRPLAASGDVIGRTRVGEIYDRGEGRGAFILTLRELIDAASGEPIATMRCTEFVRGEGGFGGPPPPKPARAAFPERAPDCTIFYPTSRQAALIYRLSGDYNPLHVDAATAKSVGFDAPILHGLSSFGMAGRAIVAAMCGGDPAGLRLIRGRFTAPVLPGETLRFELWRTEAGRCMFRVIVDARGVVALDGGEAEFTEQ